MLKCMVVFFFFLGGGWIFPKKIRKKLVPRLGATGQCGRVGFEVPRDNSWLGWLDVICVFFLFPHLSGEGC